MRLLAVDTSSSVAAVAIMDGGELAGEFILNCGKTHSQKLLPMIDVLMKNLELKPADMDIFAASTGPGSFTGLRIGVTAIKALAFAAGKPVAGIPALDALAYNMPLSEGLVCPIMDARNNQVYTALYRLEKGVQTNITEYMGISAPELVQLIKGKNSKAVFIGDGILIHREYLKSELGENCSFAPPSHMLQRASTVAQLALQRAISGQLESSLSMVPFYLRKSQAERELDKKLKRKESEI